jgi:hypothetical protein
LSEWRYAEQYPTDELCHLQYFAVKKRQAQGDVEFVITVREYVRPPDSAMRFLAQADKQTNQKTAPFTPSGWGNSLFEALTQCIREIHRFPYEPLEPRATTSDGTVS